MKIQSQLMKTIFIAAALASSACGGVQAPLETAHIEVDVKKVLDAQIILWNAGDIDAFMETYVKSDTLRFASGGDVKKGWQATLDNYKVRYTDKTAMGKLSSRDLEIKVLSSEYVQVFGRWELVRKADKPSGLFTLLFQNVDGRWVIVSDHTSSN